MDISARGRGSPRRRTPPVAKLKVPAVGRNGNGQAEAADFDLKKLLRALQAMRDGDFSVRLAPDQTGLAGKIADAFNEVVSCNQRLCHELERAGQMVGKEGKTRVRVTSERRVGAWGAMESSVNTLIDDLLWPTAEVTRTITSVAKGDLTQSMRLEADGQTKETAKLRKARRAVEAAHEQGDEKRLRKALDALDDVVYDLE